MGLPYSASVPVLWAKGFRLGGPSSVVVASRPTSMAYYATVPDVFVQFGQPRAVLPRGLARTRRLINLLFVHLS